MRTVYVVLRTCDHKTTVEGVFADADAAEMVAERLRHPYCQVVIDARTVQQDVERFRNQRWSVIVKPSGGIAIDLAGPEGYAYDASVHRVSETLVGGEPAYHVYVEAASVDDAQDIARDLVSQYRKVRLRRKRRAIRSA